MTAFRRVNVGCGPYPLRDWINIDEQPCYGDLHLHVPPLPFADGEMTDIWASHFLEHLTPADADAFLDECWRCLQPGGRLGLVVPDTREIAARYVKRTDDVVEYPCGVFRPVKSLETLCEMFLYSTVQPSPHRWSYDLETLRALLERHRFRVTADIHRWEDPRIGVGAWYQCGWDAVKEP